MTAMLVHLKGHLGSDSVYLTPGLARLNYSQTHNEFVNLISECLVSQAGLELIFVEARIYRLRTGIQWNRAR
jgi:hypothetical protein